MGLLVVVFQTLCSQCIVTHTLVGVTVSTPLSDFHVMCQ